jgi:hypothetical protein
MMLEVCQTSRILSRMDGKETKRVFFGAQKWGVGRLITLIVMPDTTDLTFTDLLQCVNKHLFISCQFSHVRLIYPSSRSIDRSIVFHNGVSNGGRASAFYLNFQHPPLSSRSYSGCLRLFPRLPYILLMYIHKYIAYINVNCFVPHCGPNREHPNIQYNEIYPVLLPICTAATA